MPKTTRKTVETNEFDAFTRRIVRAYARRVAAGDIEALTALHQLTSTVDIATAEAVHGLRAFGYSWTDIANRLGVTRQAAQMRWGDRHDRDRIDDRLLSLGLGITVAELVSLFADHHPGSPPAEQCPGCAYPYPTGITDCPTNKLVRRLLYQRRHEDRTALSRLSPDQYGDLLDRRAARANRATEPMRSVHPTSDSAASLLGPTPGGPS